MQNGMHSAHVELGSYATDNFHKVHFAKRDLVQLAQKIALYNISDIMIDHLPH